MLQDILGQQTTLSCQLRIPALAAWSSMLGRLLTHEHVGKYKSSALCSEGRGTKCLAQTTHLYCFTLALGYCSYTYGLLRGFLGAIANVFTYQIHILCFSIYYISSNMKIKLLEYFTRGERPS